MAIEHMRPARHLLLLLIVAFVSAPFASTAQTNAISAGQLWTLPTQLPKAGNLTPPGATDIYGTITNRGTVPDAIIGVTSPAGSAAQFVIWVKGFQLSNSLPLALPAGKQVALTSQTQFLRITGGSANWKAGNNFPLTLHFQHAPDQKLSVVVKNTDPGHPGAPL